METIKGYVDHIVFRSEETLYTVLELVAGKKAISVVGKFESIDEGETIEVDGEYELHPRHGKQLHMSSYRSLMPEDMVSIARYLGSGAIKGIGQSLASRILERFGADSLRIMEQEPERLAEIKGISENKARDIAAQLSDKKGLRDAMMFLQQYGISNTLAVKIYQHFGATIYPIIQQNPYQLADEIDGIGFRIADEIASKVGIMVDSDFRISSGLQYLLMQAGAEGHLFLPKEVLIQRASSLLELSENVIGDLLPNLAMERKIIIKQQEDFTAVYAPSAYYAELNCARMLHDLALAGMEATPAIEEGMYRKLSLIEKQSEIELDELQRKAVIEAMTNGVFILSGGPGTGKTTTTKAIIEFLRSEGMEFFLAAPTGRAAKRIQETTGYEARTIHRMLEVTGITGADGRTDAGRSRFERNEENPLEVDAVIVDEMSMVDIYLLQSLLKAITVGTRLILIGDANQLPSVGPGQVLRDLIASECFSTVILKKIFRQAESSDIVMNAHRIHNGEEIRLDTKSKDFFFLERNDPNVICKHTVELLKGNFPAYVGAESLEVQVLTPMKKGALGAYNLNRVLQQYLNPPSPDKKEHTYGEDELFREGDKVMQIKNNYQLEWKILGAYGIPIDRGMGVFNGDMGIIKEINDAAGVITVLFDENKEVMYPYSALEELELAYAITIHKSQGSEYPGVIMPLLAPPRMLMNRNLLYTGVTRARGGVMILGSKETILEMIANEKELQRFSGLRLRLRELIGKKE